MKKYIYSLVMAVSMITMSSCENNFDANIYGTLSTTNFPKTGDDFESYMMECYLPFCSHWSYRLADYNQRQWFCATGGIYKYFDSTADDMTQTVIVTYGGGWTEITQCYFENFKTAPRTASDGYPNHFEKIRDITRFTQVIQTLEDAEPNTTFSAQKKAELTGEARLLRGMMMYYMLHVFGPVPVIVDASKIGVAEEEAYLVRPTLKEMVQYITDDFEYAAANMAEKQKEQGRYTADFARFFLMHHYLNEGYHMDGYYQKAYDMFNQFKGGYSLFTEGTNPYLDQFSVNHKFNSEVIMAMPCSTAGTGGAATGNMNCMTYYCFPGDASAKDDNGESLLPFANQNRGAGSGWRQCFAISKDFYDSFEEGDLRKDGIITRYYSKNGYWVDESKLGDLWDGYIVNKYNPESSTTQYQGNDVALARWADVLLMYAEADVRAHNSVSQSAINAVNQVRQRAGISNLSADKTSSVNAFMDALLEERGHELWFEGQRKIDLIRFNKYYTTMSALGRTPTSEYIPLPDYAVEQAKNSGHTLEQYFTRDNYDGPKK